MQDTWGAIIKWDECTETTLGEWKGPAEACCQQCAGGQIVAAIFGAKEVHKHMRLIDWVKFNIP